MKIENDELERVGVPAEEFRQMVDQLESFTSFTENQSICYLLITKYGLSPEKASEVLPIQAGTVRKHKHRAIEKEGAARLTVKVINSLRD